jgi:hypothetical protein
MAKRKPIRGMRKLSNANNTRRIQQLLSNKMQLSSPRAMSLLGKTFTRQLDCRVNIFAVNSIGGGFYSFGTSVAAPSVSVNLTNLLITQYPEYSQLVRTYGLIKLLGTSIQFSRTSSLIQNTTVIGNTPSMFLQLSMTQYSAGSTATQAALATADNAVEINVQTYDPYSWNLNFPPVVIGRSASANDIFAYGSDVWSPTIINGIQVLPDVFINLGSLEFPSFQSGAANTSFQLATLHVRFNCVFAGPQSL